MNEDLFKLELPYLINTEVKVRDALCVVEEVNENGNIMVRAKFMGYRFEVTPKDFLHWQFHTPQNGDHELKID